MRQADEINEAVTVLDKLWEFATTKIATKDDIAHLESRLDTIETRLVRLEVEVKGISDRLSLQERIEAIERELADQ